MARSSRTCCGRVPWDALGIAAGFAADCAFADPQHGHPVALFGRAASAAEKWLYQDSRPAGVAYEAALVGLPTLCAALLAGPRNTPRSAAMLAVTTYFALGGTSLARTGEKMAAALERDTEEARQWVPWLCSRDPQALDADGMARATVESLAENTSDATVSTLFWGVVGGAPGVVMHRCANTLDAMVGYKSARYLQFGWAAAKFDDVLNYLPARVAGLIQIGLAGKNAPRAVRAWARSASRHPSPNAGVVESTAAGALGVTLGGRTEYSYGVEMRPELGEGPAPVVSDVRRAVALSRRVQWVSAGLAVAAAGLLVGRRGRGSQG